jgi:hypothetical protein
MFHSFEEQTGRWRDITPPLCLCYALQTKTVMIVDFLYKFYPHMAQQQIDVKLANNGQEFCNMHSVDKVQLPLHNNAVTLTYCHIITQCHNSEDREFHIVGGCQYKRSQKSQ